MSWGETKKLADVITSNVVPSEVIVKQIFNINEMTVQGSGAVFVDVHNTSSGGSFNVKVDDEDAVGIVYLMNHSVSELFAFKEKFNIKSNNGGANVLCTFFLYDRQSLGGGQSS